MKPNEFYDKSLKGTEAGEVIEDNHLKLAVITLLTNYAGVLAKEQEKLSLPVVSQQRELLIAYHKWSGFTDDNGDLVDENEIDEFLSNL